MKFTLQDSKIESYLKESGIINFKNELLAGYADRLVDGISNNVVQIKTIYKFVRDEISHSFDIGVDNVTFKASEVLKEKHGVCYAKSHLLAALLRSIGVPTGFCYQGLIFDDVDDRRVILHGLVAVYIKEIDKWIRLDPRGNKPGVDAQFSLTEERLAFPVRKELGEFDTNIIYSEPAIAVQRCLHESKNKDELILNLPGKV